MEVDIAQGLYHHLDNLHIVVIVEAYYPLVGHFRLYDERLRRSSFSQENTNCWIASLFLHLEDFQNSQKRILSICR